jgi:hypothetical protein
MKILLFVFALVLTVSVFAGAASAASSKARKATILPAQLETSIKQSGLILFKQSHTVSTASCEGQLGQPGPKYHSFWCQVLVPDMPMLRLIHVNAGAGGGWAWTPMLFGLVNSGGHS